MFTFTYQNPVRIHFGAGMIARIGEELPATARVLLLYGGGSILRNGVLAQIRNALGRRHCVEFAGIEPNPHYSTCMKAIEVGRAAGVTHVLAAGGGSVIDAGKFISAGLPLAPGEDPWSFVNGRPVERALPLGVVVTLAASGSEANSTAVITHDILREKRVFFAPAVFPAFSILDPDTMCSLPRRQRINGVVDPWMHVVEQYLTFPIRAEVQDRFSEALLQVLFSEGPRFVEGRDDASVRSNLMWAASLALNGLNGAGVPQDWATHMIGHELTMAHGLDHAQSLAVVHPAVLRRYRVGKQAKMLQLGERVFGMRRVDFANEQAMAEAVIEAESAFFERLGASTRLSAYGVGEESIPGLQHNLCKVLSAMGLKGLGEHQAITTDEVGEILRLAL